MHSICGTKNGVPCLLRARITGQCWTREVWLHCGPHRTTRQALDCKKPRDPTPGVRKGYSLGFLRNCWRSWALTLRHHRHCWALRKSWLCGPWAGWRPGSHSRTSQIQLHFTEELRMCADPQADFGLGAEGKRVAGGFWKVTPGRRDSG